MNYTAFQFKTNLRKRILATVIDYGLYLLAFYTYVTFFGYENEEGGQTVSGMMALPVFAGWFIYFVLIESWYGATPGHQVFNLKVLTLSRDQIGLSHSLKRHFLDPIDILFYGIPAIIAIKNTDKHQRLGDLWAKTFIVDTTDPDQFEVIK